MFLTRGCSVGLQVASRRFAELAICVYRLKALIFEAQGQQHSDLEIQLEFIPRFVGARFVTLPLSVDHYDSANSNTSANASAKVGELFTNCALIDE